jgi:hypothetical protein
MSNSELAGRFWSGGDGRKLRDGANRQPQSPNEVSLIHSCHERFSLPCGGPLDSTFDHNQRNAQRSACRRRYRNELASSGWRNGSRAISAPACWLLRRLKRLLTDGFSFLLFHLLPCSGGGLGTTDASAHRYHLELDLSLCLLGISGLPSILRFAKSNKLFPWLLLPLAIFSCDPIPGMSGASRATATGRSMSRPQCSTRFRLGFVITPTIEKCSSRAQRSSGSTPEPGPQEIVRRTWYHGCFGSGWWGPADDHKIRTGTAP